MPETVTNTPEITSTSVGPHVMTIVSMPAPVQPLTPEQMQDISDAIITSERLAAGGGA